VGRARRFGNRHQLTFLIGLQIAVSERRGGSAEAAAQTLEHVIGILNHGSNS
jgi:hypothetical protein